MFHQAITQRNLTCSKTQRRQPAKINVRVCSALSICASLASLDEGGGPCCLSPRGGEGGKGDFPAEKTRCKQEEAPPSATQLVRCPLGSGLSLRPREPLPSSISSESGAQTLILFPVMFTRTRGHPDEDQREPWSKSKVTEGCRQLRMGGAGGG